jgi:hypothetical protein
LRDSSDEPGGRRNASGSKGKNGLQKEVTFNEMQLPGMDADDEDEEEEFDEDPKKKIFSTNVQQSGDKVEPLVSFSMNLNQLNEYLWKIIKVVNQHAKLLHRLNHEI